MVSLRYLCGIPKGIPGIPKGIPPILKNECSEIDFSILLLANGPDRSRSVGVTRVFTVSSQKL